MRSPLLKAFLWLLAALTGTALLVAVVSQRGELGKAAIILGGLAGLALFVLGGIFLLVLLRPAFGEARLRGGFGVIARWSVSPEEWELFRAFDAARGAEQKGTLNVLRKRKRRPRRPVGVLVGHRQILVDGSYHGLNRFGVPELRAVGWLRLPGRPECLEFDLAYPRGDTGWVIPARLRVPVPPAAQGPAAKAFEHFRAPNLVPPEGLADRHPWLVIGGGGAVAMLSVGAALGGYLLKRAGTDGFLSSLLVMGGTVGAIGAVLFMVIVALTSVHWVRG
jgi:hypothetical protein